MKRVIFFDALILSIEKLYCRLALTILHKRMTGYHAQALQSIKPYASDIKSPLLECINVLIDTNQDDPAAPRALHYSILAGSTTHLPIPAKHDTAELHVINKENVGELSKYFKEKNHGGGLHPGIAEKLEHSTWEHIHAAIRYAKQCDNRKAKMHADIASCACKELAHFMNDEHYLAFVMEIETHLNALKT